MSEPQISLQLPIFDMSQPIPPCCLSSLSLACQEWGFFHITNHGVSKELFHKVRSLSQHIFSLPTASKLKLGPLSSLKSYTPHFIASPFFESLRVSGPDFFASGKSSADELLGEKSVEFSEALQDYGNKMVNLSKRIIEAVLMSLGDGCEKFYESEFNKCRGYLRIVNYSPPENVKDEVVEGLGMHTDMSCITMVYQDDVGGLQMRSKDGKWIDICPCENSLVVNIGDLLQAWSNGRLRSSEHRVVLKQSVNRFSLAFFWCFEDEKVILAPEEVVGLKSPRNYKPFVCLDYLKFRESNEKGKFEKVGYTVKDFAGLRFEA
ncbi:Non-hem dioxygenase N-terminal domain, partial [Dillenia turbinata]